MRHAPENALSKISLVAGFVRPVAPHENPRDTHLSGYSIKVVLWWNMPGKHIVLDPFPGASWCPLAHWWTWKEWKCDHKTSLCATPCRADAPRGKLSLWFRNKLWELFMFFYWLRESCQMMASNFLLSSSISNANYWLRVVRVWVTVLMSLSPASRQPNNKDTQLMEETWALEW